jgi:hypothetical protein
MHLTIWRRSKFGKKVEKCGGTCNLFADLLSSTLHRPEPGLYALYAVR